MDRRGRISYSFVLIRERMPTSSQNPQPDRPAAYRIRVQGRLDAAWEEWFGGLRLESGPDGVTTLAGPVRDQGELYGLLARIRDLGLPLLQVERLDAPGPEDPGEG